MTEGDLASKSSLKVKEMMRSYIFSNIFSKTSGCIKVELIVVKIFILRFSSCLDADNATCSINEFSTVNVMYSSKKLII